MGSLEVSFGPSDMRKFSRVTQVDFQRSGNSRVWPRHTRCLECRCGTVVARRRDFGRKQARSRQPVPAKRPGLGRSVGQLRAIRSDFWNCSGDLGLPGDVRSHPILGVCSRRGSEALPPAGNFAFCKNPALFCSGWRKQHGTKRLREHETRLRRRAMRVLWARLESIRSRAVAQWVQAC